ncbi:hypothetical protein OG900_17980 [Streptomyces sp. NBC_00433]
MSQSDPPGRSPVATPPRPVLHDVLNREPLDRDALYALDVRTTDGSPR